MKRTLGLLCALVSLLAAGCGGGSSSAAAPSRPSPGLSSGTNPIAIGQPATSSLFGSSSADLASCLHALADPACFSGSRMSARAVGAAATAPGAPVNFSAAASGGTVTLTWTAPVSGDPVVTYVIEAGSSSGASNLANIVTNNTATTFSASGVGAGTYYVRVRAQNAGGVSGPSNESILIVGTSACTSAPNAPGGLVTSVSGTTVTLTWTAPVGGCAPTAYILQAGSAAGLSNLANSNTGNTATSYVAPGVGAGTYFVRIIAVNAYGQSAASNESTLVVGRTGNGAPVIGALTVSPQGIGLQSATIFTFLGQNVSDPDGDPLTYSWLSSDGASITSSTQAASHVYARSGTFQMRLTVTDPAGLSASATVSVGVGTVTGVWDVSCARSTITAALCPNFPTQFVATLTQSGSSLFGSMTGGGLTRTFTMPGQAYDPRRFVFGVETRDNVWCFQDGDFYFYLDANDTLTSGSGTAYFAYCSGTSTARKR